MKRYIFGILGLFLAALGIYGFVKSPGFSLNGFTSIHNLYHLLSGVVILWIAYKNKGMVIASRLFGFLFLPTIFESYIGHHMTIESHTITHIVVTVLFLILGFVPMAKRKE